MAHHVADVAVLLSEYHNPRGHSRNGAKRPLVDEHPVVDDSERNKDVHALANNLQTLPPNRPEMKVFPERVGDGVFDDTFDLPLHSGRFHRGGEGDELHEHALRSEKAFLDRLHTTVHFSIPHEEPTEVEQREE